MSSTENTRKVPTRAIIMILVSVAIMCAAIGTYGLVTRNDDPQAALRAQEAKIDRTATQTAAAAAPVCLISVARAPVDAAKDALTKAGTTPAGETEAWPARPAAPRETTVYFDAGAEQQAKSVSAALPGSAVAARPDGLQVCPGSVAVAVVA